MRPDMSVNLQNRLKTGAAAPKVAHATKQRQTVSNPLCNETSSVVDRL